ncbi:MAG: DUF6600 domain-containing protein [Terriglobia bacterium]
MIRRPLTAISIVLGLAFSAFLTPGFAQQKTTPPMQKLSHVRVVRLSFIQGTVTVRRPGATEWAKGLVNSPIEQGFSIATAPKSFAEVEFENGSTVRLGELSRLDFTELALTPNGDKINHLAFDQGYATYHFLPEHNDDYQVKTADATLTPHGKAEFRTDFEHGKLRVEVFSGQVDVTNPRGAERLNKDKVLAYNTGSNQSFDVTRGIQKDEWDKWAMARDQQTTLAYNDQAMNPGSSMYGWSDLGTYGDWAYYPGYGYGWAPYEPMGWSPYSTGMWGFYPSFGYTWISGQPWGWLPFHYGLWNFDSSMGWFWMPGFMGGPWSPALVNWYAGAGLIGWGPMGMGGLLPCSVGMAGCIVTAPAGTLLNGKPVATGGGPAPGEVKRIPGPRLPLSAGLPGLRLPKGVIFPGGPHGALIASGGGLAPPNMLARGNTLTKSPAASGAAMTHVASGRIARSSAASSFTRGAAGAPSSIVMGKQVSAQSVLTHHSFFDRTFGAGREPVHAALGNTLGGRFPTVAGKHGALMPRPVPQSGRGMDVSRGFSGSRSFSRAGGPVALPHMSSGGAARSSGNSGFSGASFGGGHSGSVGFSAPAAVSAAPGAGAGHGGGGGASRH